MQNELLLGAAIVAEIIGTSWLRMSEGLARLGPAAGISVFYGASFVSLALALRSIEMSVAYPIC